MSILSAIFGSKQEESKELKILNADAYKKAITNKKVQLVDVRTPREFAGGHISNAINIDYFDKVSFQKSFDKLSRNKAVYLYCQSGNRSRKAANRLIQMGFKEIYDLKGGLLAW
jgi:rhodanese-related sulfurtransferase